MNRRYAITKQTKYVIKANLIQKKNYKLLDFIRKRVEYDPGIKQGDFIVGNMTKIFYLTYKYHSTNIKYLEECIVPLIEQSNEYLNIVLFVIDCKINEINEEIIQDVNIKLFKKKCTLIIAQSYSDAAHYIEEFSVVENSQNEVSDQINERTQIINALSMIKGINSQNAYDLLMKFNTLKRLGVVDKDELKKSKNIGPKKVESIWRVFHSPIVGTKKMERSIQTFLKSLTIEKKKINKP
ncbi:DNA excision repair protein, putative [Entamoeba histolytica HM-1:IMSS-B]|uniref:DNA excision repair protein, putative n=4 Tax=Entamoeba histolytica TaxID=5759 RepID=C4LW01_ENTH1|nr:DNA excision repair protein, putative [Entamoeba histolytica HM-1:IMSS]EAL47090.1 DNA excision repair protein, putative [Entamoeba histolytica HM-1:IMSS]EMH77105.1 DNA excision repair protein, putative [Entamoeba histolytica HM-1:IMSS-B]ENY62404.1 DNA excision repair protein, putative [Entamoeba histolytica HM-1:IMSS-A]GAT92862.1 DNA excision repair protein putative [Entamoeba histolytica]|eukprot:XP_652464.1 DNA excision repair protein, putative [Entamoeba histolytica HM-1:IMSS]